MQVDLTELLAERIPTNQVNSETPSGTTTMPTQGLASQQNWVLAATKGKKNNNYYTGDSLGQLSRYSRDSTWKQLKVNPGKRLFQSPMGD